MDTNKIQLNSELDTTVFVNIDEDRFVFHINKQPREVEAGEQKVMPLYVAQVGAKHLVDKILQKNGVRDTLRDTPERRTLFARILPDISKQLEIIPQSKEDYETGIALLRKRQEELEAKLRGENEDLEKLREQNKSLTEKVNEMDATVRRLEAERIEPIRRKVVK